LTRRDVIVSPKGIAIVPKDRAIKNEIGSNAQLNRTTLLRECPLYLFIKRID